MLDGSASSANVRRVPVFGLGCAGGVNGLSIAARLAAADPGSRWLFVTVETCSISIRLDSDDPAAVVATALFGDGAAAAVVTSGEHSVARITGTAEKLWPDTLRIMGWDVEDPGLAVVFDRAIPPFIEAELAKTVDEMCSALSITRDEIGRFCCHPGGVKVIDAIESALELPQGELNLEREVLHDYGNMSAPDRLVRARTPPRAGTSRQDDDDRIRPRVHLRRNAARSCVILNIVILSLVTLERLAEMWIARRNTLRLVRRGAREHSPGHYPLIVAVHVLWLASLWWLAPSRRSRRFLARTLHSDRARRGPG